MNASDLPPEQKAAGSNPVGGTQLCAGQRVFGALAASGTLDAAGVERQRRTRVIEKYFPAGYMVGRSLRRPLVTLGRRLDDPSSDEGRWPAPRLARQPSSRSARTNNEPLAA